MDNGRYGIRASGDYAVYRGHEYLAYRRRDHVRLLSDDDPLPAGFQASTKNWVRGEAVVPLNTIARLTRVQTTCVWRGHEFSVGIIVDAIANVTYLGGRFGDVSRLPGMARPDKYEVVGDIPVSELGDVHEHVEEVSLAHHAPDESQLEAQ